MSKFEYIPENHRNFKNLLLSFLEDTYLDDERPENISPQEFSMQCDYGTIKRYIETFEAKYIMETITQGREIVALEEFPWEWIRDTANRYPFDKWYEATSDDFHEWITWIIDELEKHAKLAGKFIAEPPEIEKDRQNKTISKGNKDLKLHGFGFSSDE